ncbi:hypothetical protein CPC735_006210 [Coccidioides posadasii C735 delta SOWgp]|uniref:Uncharacterized protein n=3 Tax=Coccidioides posadasii TaxID=199306 RepID=E9CZ04_COCPS|nr:hypothetical protein CPC735_006210 [Coccidioides posadasii C735 delta SOWgp]EER26449.1 hypothetical protein CPC735_006210 [Coccidioides posadasii C735 delta SOWgp]EFW20448.1 conserved hypothetical protein [Coccidioides posadasii str. Silveira]KMM72985.1 hypothetical protein CPAG_09274 [Coccidioides posadasii RMSCC 3488]|eukprot:XP_003068594.1 hypothetical protein CPC735_006210 [Coccidioides posadasii C735 delta SOWgp]
MTWYSLLPAELTAFEGWLIRFFIILGTLTIVPWAFFIVYDILLYIWRATTYEIPVIGGRARGRHRPVVPSLSERPSGRQRAFSLTGTTSDGGKGTRLDDRGNTSVSSLELSLSSEGMTENEASPTGNGSCIHYAGEVKKRKTG